MKNKNNKFKNIVIGILLIIILILVIVVLFSKDSRYKTATVQNHSKGSDKTVTVIKDNPNVTFQGYKDMSVSKSNPYIVLTNPVKNKDSNIGMVYRLLESKTKSVLTETSVLKPGDIANVKLYPKLQNKETSVIIQAKPIKSGTGYSGIDMTVNITKK